MDAIIISAVSGSAILLTILVAVCVACIVRRRRSGKCRWGIFDCRKLVKRFKMLLKHRAKDRRYSEDELRKLSIPKNNNNQNGERRQIPQLPSRLPYGTLSEHHLQLEACESIESYSEHELPTIDIYNCAGTDGDSPDRPEVVTPLPSEATPRGKHMRKLSSSLSPMSKLGRSKSAGEAVIRKSLVSQGTIIFSVSYQESARKLKVEVQNLTKLNVDSATTGRVYVRIHLVPKETSFVETEHVICDTDLTDFSQEFEFEDFYIEDLTKSHLRMVVYGKCTGKTRDRFIGEVFTQLSEIKALSDIPTMCMEEIKPSRLKKKSTSDKFLFLELGQLFIHLQYQPLAQRMKVVVRRGENFPKRSQKFSMVMPDHYITINLLRNKEILRTKHTRTQNGCSPVWNEAFLFDLPTDKKMSEYSFNFVVMRGKLYKKDDIIGHVIIGANTTKTGIAHWDEALMPRALETARWHDITPVISY